MKKIITSICMLVLAAVLFGSSTFAWFSMNRTVGAKGMQVKAHVDTSLIIGTAMPTTATTTTVIDQGETEATELYNSTRWDEATCKGHGVDTRPTAGLVKIANAEYVDQTTGLYSMDESINPDKTACQWAAATNNTSTKTIYYVDYIYYIAAIGPDAVSGKNLEITITSNTSSVDTTSIDGAISVDFYVLPEVKGSETAPTSASFVANKYVGTLNLAGKDAIDNDATAFEKLTLESVTIPKAGAAETDSKAYVVLCRVYLDGNLCSVYNEDDEEATQNYVRTAAYADITDLELEIEFKCVTPASK